MRSTPDWPLLVSGDANKDRSVDAWTRDFDRFFRTASLRALFHGAPHGGAARHQRIAALDQGQSQSQDQKSSLYGRALVVLAAEQHASRLVVPRSQQHPPMRWPSHQDRARKALAKLAGPHLPSTLKQLEKAVERAHSEHENASTRVRKAKNATGTPRPGAASAAAGGDIDDDDDNGDGGDAGVEYDGDLEPGNAEDPDA